MCHVVTGKKERSGGHGHPFSKLAHSSQPTSGSSCGCLVPSLGRFGEVHKRCGRDPSDCRVYWRHRLYQEVPYESERDNKAAAGLLDLLVATTTTLSNVTVDSSTPSPHPFLSCLWDPDGHAREPAVSIPQQSRAPHMQTLLDGVVFWVKERTTKRVREEKIPRRFSSLYMFLYVLSNPLISSLFQWTPGEILRSFFLSLSVSL